MLNVNPKYKESDEVLMKIIKTTTLPDEDIYYVLEDPNGMKYLLPQKYYLNYNLKISQTINCRIDKINCTGNIFFEPQHPVYILNNSYNFEILEKKRIENSAGLIVDVAVVTDVFQNTIFVPIDNDKNSKPGDLIKCKIDRIKKGKLFLSKVDSKQVRLLKSKIYDFKIISIEKYSDGDYFKLIGPNDSLHRIPEKYYHGYNFRIGMKIQCKVEKYLSNIDYLLEPIHPFYEIDKVYDFEFIENRIESNHFGEERRVLIVKDILNKEARVFIENEIHAQQLKKGEIIKCKVLKFIKGTLILEMI
ncbi:MAG: hypothetical protein K9J13_05205 [Saprospiraceae bacterium]|nr:hypothetical protein [Saprospiraceae bacterium]